MKALGLDLGSKTLGIAISDLTRTLARGLETYRFQEEDYTSALDYLLKVIEREKISTIVLGYPKNMDGTVGKQGQVSEHFKAMIESKSHCEVILWDERLSSKQAVHSLTQNTKKSKRKKRTDEVAAIILLQSFLDAKK